MSTGARVGGYVLRFVLWAVPIGGVLWAANVVLDQGADWWEVALYTLISAAPLPWLTTKYGERYRRPVLVVAAMVAVYVVIMAIFTTIFRSQSFFVWVIFGVMLLSAQELFSWKKAHDDARDKTGGPTADDSRDPAAD
ncbi:hypothetical protein GCM10011512_24900 [Tersicoccus solisilvae]|uniref:Uncharacterized protein n=1 Tax=Tersicoccus solisilvae TaxID=1882339 RepID=A0ABQ1PGQ6_9MICC|nr:hypothetical protein [Tersicoccus solisilvae]GGC96891.1 hypothetical protein GCM10011512_24900 [Tersicoccus solisilvae]